MQRLVYEGRLAMHGPTHPETLMGAQNYAMLLQHSGRSAEAVPLDLIRKPRHAAWMMEQAVPTESITGIHLLVILML